jgi:hypothetical protein
VRAVAAFHSPFPKQNKKAFPQPNQHSSPHGTIQYLIVAVARSALGHALIVLLPVTAKTYFEHTLAASSFAEFYRKQVDESDDAHRERFVPSFYLNWH